MTDNEYQDEYLAERKRLENARKKSEANKKKRLRDQREKQQQRTRNRASRKIQQEARRKAREDFKSEIGYGFWSPLRGIKSRIKEYRFIYLPLKAHRDFWTFKWNGYTSLKELWIFYLTLPFAVTPLIAILNYVHNSLNPSNPVNVEDWGIYLDIFYALFCAAHIPLWNRRFKSFTGNSKPAWTLVVTCIFAYFISAILEYKEMDYQFIKPVRQAMSGASVFFLALAQLVVSFKPSTFHESTKSLHDSRVARLFRVTYIDKSVGSDHHQITVRGFNEDQIRAKMGEKFPNYEIREINHMGPLDIN